ncbi:MAG: hypothetical protein AAB819_00515 [Patescibacteria group bacterium]
MESPARRKLLKNARNKRVRKNACTYSFYIVGGIVLFALLIGGLAYGAHRSEVTITGVRVSGAEVADEQDIVSRAEAALSGAYLFMFPKANFFLYPENAIVREILASDTRIKSTDVSRSGVEITVTVVEHTPTYLWCDTTDDRRTRMNADGKERIDADGSEQGDEECFFTNDEGYVFSEAPLFSGNVYITLRGPLYGEGTDPRGKRYLPLEQFKKISQLLALLSQQKIAAHSVRAMGSGDYAVGVRNGLEVRFSIAQDTGRLAENLQSASAALVDTNDIEYIDLRFGNKVFYK